MTSNPIRQYPGCAISSLGGDECLHWSVYLSGPAAGERPAVSLRADFPLDSSQSIRGVHSFVPFKLKVTGVQSRSQTTVVPSESFRHCISSSILLILPWRWPLWEMKNMVGSAWACKGTDLGLIPGATACMLPVWLWGSPKLKICFLTQRTLAGLC